MRCARACRLRCDEGRAAAGATATISFVIRLAWSGIGREGVGIVTPDDALLTDEGLKTYRDAYCQGIRDYHAQDKQAGKQAKWPLRFLIRHTAFHTLDHAWEMEDKDLSVKPGEHSISSE
jgi:hypothetical protein